MSPALLSFRFRSHPPDRWPSQTSTSTRPRRASTPLPAAHAGRDEAGGDDDGYGRPVWTSYGHGVDHDPFASSSAPHDDVPSRPSATALPAPRKHRTSILMAASDVLGFKFGRRRPPARQYQEPIILPDVIEITARKRDEEEEERNRLRAEAAHAIGLDPLLAQSDAHSHYDTTDEDEDDRDSRPKDSNTTATTADSQHSNVLRNPNNPSQTNAPVHGSNSSIATSNPLPMPVGRLRSGSLGVHSRTNSATLTPIPQYPSTITVLTQFQQHSGKLSKYYHPSSLRIFALSNSKNWKDRFIMLTSPTAIVARNRGPASSFLHLFKAQGPEEKELERLEINEDSVVFVSDDEVGGRRHVVKVGGLEAGAFKKELNYEESGRTMWFLQIEDSAESQQWISSIKSTILNQRAIRAGLLPATSFGANEPRGDIDVMLSMRAQGFITSSGNSTARLHLSTPPSTVVQAEKNYASSISSHSVRSQASSRKHSITVSTLKGFFSGSRPRSASRTTSVDTSKPQQHDANEDAFSSMGNNIMSMLRSTTPDVQSQSSGATVVRANSPLVPSATQDIGIDRRIAPNRQPLQFVTNGPSAADSKNRNTKSLSLGSMSLQPPPRKRWTMAAVAPVVDPAQPTPEVYQNAQYNGTTGSLGALTYYKEQDPGPPASPTTTNVSVNDGQDRPRAPSLQSVSTYGSNENSMSHDRSSNSTKRSSGTRRWSRHGPLPPKTAPPSVPPPNPPASVSRPQLSVVDNRPSSSASSRSGQSQQSLVSSLPSFSKRTSTSSVGTSSTSQSTGSNYPMARPVNSHRISMPPPARPAPTSALPPAPGEWDRSKSSDSLPSLTTPKAKRTSVVGRGFRLSMIAPKPPPSSTLPPRPDELDYMDSKQDQSRTTGVSGSRLSHLNAIPSSPDPGAVFTSPFPPPRGPLPPTPTSELTEDRGNGHANNRPSSGPSQHTSFKQRLRMLSAPSSSSSASANTIINATNTSQSQTHTRPNSSSFASRLSGSHHTRNSSTGSVPHANTFASLANHNIHANSSNNRSSAPPPLTFAPSHYGASGSQPPTPIGEKIMLFPHEPSFLQLVTPITPSVPLPSIRPLPAIPVVQEMTSLSPPPRRNSKHLIVIEPPPTPPPPTTQHSSDDAVSPSLSPPPTQPLLLSLPPSPALQPAPEDKLATPPDSPESETRETSSRPASIISLGM